MTGQPQNLGPLEREPGQIRPPFTGEWTPFEQKRGESADSWRSRVRADREAALLEPLEGIELGAYDMQIVEWLSTWEDSTLATIASWLYRVRAAGQQPAGGDR